MPDVARNIEQDDHVHDQELSAPYEAAGRNMRSAQIDALTGIRALASLWVLSFHFRALILTAFPSIAFLVPLMNVGYLGVDLFFFLSGFILTYVHAKDFSSFGVVRNSAPRFVWLRLSRIWPAATVMLLIWGAYNVFWMWVLADPTYQARLDPLRLLRHLTLTQAWTPEHHDWNPVDWSISSEWLAYLTVLVFMPLLVKITQRLSQKQLMLLGLLCVLPMVLVGLGMQDGTDLLWHDDTLIPGMAILRVLTEFWAGACLCQALSSRLEQSRRGAIKPRRPWAILLLLSVIVVIYGFSRINPFWNPRFGSPWVVEGRNMLGSNESVLVLPLLLLLIGALTLYEDSFTRVLASRLLVFLGTISYSIYLTHWLFLDLLQRLVAMRIIPDSGRYFSLALVCALVASVLSGWVLWRFVEEPVRRKCRDVFPKKLV